MTDSRAVGQEMQAQILDTVRKSQEAVVEALQTWADAVSSITPPLPNLTPALTDKLPKPEEFVASAYDFAAQLLAGQRKFAEDVLQVTGSITQKNSPSKD
jgi:hypothetical protein